jgi:hypothetical protein
MYDFEPREASQAENPSNNSLILGHFSLQWGGERLPTPNILRGKSLIFPWP